MLSATVHRDAEEVVCRGHRHALRVRRQGPGAGVRVDAASLAERRWRRVDGDVVVLMRAATRLLALDPAAAHATTRHAVELAAVPARDTHPVTGLVRAVFPLLATPEPWPLAGLPDVVPADLQPVLRARDPRTAARRLVGDRATRPVVRALSEQLLARPTTDVFLLEAVACAAPLLEPDHVARLLRPSEAAADDPAPLGAGGIVRLRGVLAGARPRRTVQLLEDARDDLATRRRVRFVATADASRAELDPTAGWAGLALQVAMGEAADG